MYGRQWSKPSPEKEMQKGKMVVLGGLANSWEKREAKNKGEKEKIYSSEYTVPKNGNGEIRKLCLVINAKK